MCGNPKYRKSLVGYRKVGDENAGSRISYMVASGMERRNSHFKAFGSEGKKGSEKGNCHTPPSPIS